MAAKALTKGFGRFVPIEHGLPPPSEDQWFVRFGLCPCEAARVEGHVVMCVFCEGRPRILHHTSADLR